MQQRTLGPFQVSAMGLGRMNLSHAYGAPVSTEQGERVLLSALDAGVTLFDTAALYGFGANEALVGRVLKPQRQKFTLASKCGMQGVDVNGDGKLLRVIDGRPQTDVIDLYYLPKPFEPRELVARENGRVYTRDDILNQLRGHC